MGGERSHLCANPAHQLKQHFDTSPDGLVIISCRLHLHATSSNSGGWSSLTSDPNQWLQVKFGQRVEIRRVATQGRQSLDITQWVTSYMLNYSSDGLLFYQYRTNKNQTVSSPAHKPDDLLFFQATVCTVHDYRMKVDRMSLHTAAEPAVRSAVKILVS